MPDKNDCDRTGESDRDKQPERSRRRRNYRRVLGRTRGSIADGRNRRQGGRAAYSRPPSGLELDRARVGSQRSPMLRPSQLVLARPKLVPRCPAQKQPGEPLDSSGSFYVRALAVCSGFSAKAHSIARYCTEAAITADRSHHPQASSVLVSFVVDASAPGDGQSPRTLFKPRLSAAVAAEKQLCRAHESPYTSVVRRQAERRPQARLREIVGRRFEPTVVHSWRHRRLTFRPR